MNTIHFVKEDKTNKKTFMGFPKKFDFVAAEKKRKEKEKAEANKLAKTLVKKRLLIKDGYSGVTESIFLELSPSCNYCRLMDTNGKKAWRKFEGLEVVEVLGVYKPKVKK